MSSEEMKRTCVRCGNRTIIHRPAVPVRKHYCEQCIVGVRKQFVPTPEMIAKQAAAIRATWPDSRFGDTSVLEVVTAKDWSNET